MGWQGRRRSRACQASSHCRALQRPQCSQLLAGAAAAKRPCVWVFLDPGACEEANTHAAHVPGLRGTLPCIRSICALHAQHVCPACTASVPCRRSTCALLLWAAGAGGNADTTVTDGAFWLLACCFDKSIQRIRIPQQQVRPVLAVGLAGCAQQHSNTATQGPGFLPVHIQWPFECTRGVDGAVLQLSSGGCASSVACSSVCVRPVGRGEARELKVARHTGGPWVSICPSPRPTAIHRHVPLPRSCL